MLQDEHAKMVKSIISIYYTGFAVSESQLGHKANICIIAQIDVTLRERFLWDTLQQWPLGQNLNIIYILLI